MSPDYRRNVVAHLYLTCRWMWLASGVTDLADTVLAGRQPTPAQEVPAVISVDEHTWLENTPLLRALRRLNPELAEPSELRAWALTTRALLDDDPDVEVRMFQSQPGPGPQTWPSARCTTRPRPTTTRYA